MGEQDDASRNPFHHVPHRRQDGLHRDVGERAAGAGSPQQPAREQEGPIPALHPCGDQGGRAGAGRACFQRRERLRLFARRDAHVPRSGRAHPADPHTQHNLQRQHARRTPRDPLGLAARVAAGRLGAPVRPTPPHVAAPAARVDCVRRGEPHLDVLYLLHVLYETVEFFIVRFC